MVRLVPEHLRRPELCFEIAARGEDPASTVGEMRAQWRKLSHLPLAWQGEFDLGNLLEACRERVEELEGEVSTAEGERGIMSGHLVSQLLHWKGRLEVVLTAPGLEEEARDWIDSQINIFNIFLTRGTRSTPAVPVAPPRAEVGTLATGAGPGGAVASAVLSDTGFPAPEMGVAPPSRERESRVWEPVLPPAPPGFGGVVLGSAFARGGGMGSAATCGTVSSSGSCFGKLPHPLAHVLSQVRPVDGLDTEALLGFFGLLVDMRRFPGISDATFFEVLAPLCLRPLNDLLLECWRNDTTLDHFHSAALEAFIPARILERLRLDRLYRPQRLDESLSRFLVNIETDARVLRLSLPEHQIVDIIVEGLRPEDRSRLVFCAPPKSFADLERLALRSRAIEQSDLLRGQSAGHHARTAAPAAGTSGVTGSTAPQRGPVTCFGCGQVGHTRRYCPKSSGRSGARGGKN